MGQADEIAALHSQLLELAKSLVAKGSSGDLLPLPLRLDMRVEGKALLSIAWRGASTLWVRQHHMQDAQEAFDRLRARTRLAEPVDANAGDISAIYSKQDAPAGTTDAPIALTPAPLGSLPEDEEALNLASDAHDDDQAGDETRTEIGESSSDTQATTPEAGARSTTGTTLPTSSPIDGLPPVTVEIGARTIDLVMQVEWSDKRVVFRLRAPDDEAGGPAHEEAESEENRDPNAETRSDIVVRPITHHLPDDKS